MTHCYCCGQGIQGTHYRRNVSTGYSSGVSMGFTGRSFRASGRTYTGLRTVCRSCAEQLDAQGDIQPWMLIVAIAIVAIPFLWFCLHSLKY